MDLALTHAEVLGNLPNAVKQISGERRLIVLCGHG
jgi:hypothetical protein